MASEKKNDYNRKITFKDPESFGDINDLMMTNSTKRFDSILNGKLKLKIR
jgi:hypothetical protein